MKATLIFATIMNYTKEDLDKAVKKERNRGDTSTGGLLLMIGILNLLGGGLTINWAWLLLGIMVLWENGYFKSS